MLTHLPVELHRDLFETFEKTAIWKDSAGGERVNLDEEKTPIGVFRDMYRWIAARVGSRKRPRTISSAASAALTGATGELSVSSEAAPLVPVPEASHSWLSSDGTSSNAENDSSSSSGSSGSDDERVSTAAPAVPRTA